MTLLYIVMLGIAAAFCFLRAAKAHRHYQVKPQDGALTYTTWVAAGSAAVLGAFLVAFFWLNPPPPSFDRGIKG